jgi:hypothetical protein
MFTRSNSLIALVALSALLAACNDVTSPTPINVTARPSFKSSSNDSSLVSGGGGGGGGGSAAATCGILSTTVQTYNIVVYTTRIGIGFSGQATNCGSKKAAFEVDVVDTDPNPACTVDVPHFIAAKNTDPGASVTWAANSTLVPCQNKTHTFNLRLWDTKTGQTLATSTVSAFL